MYPPSTMRERRLHDNDETDLITKTKHK